LNSGINIGPPVIRLRGRFLNEYLVSIFNDSMPTRTFWIRGSRIVNICDLFPPSWKYFYLLKARIVATILIHDKKLFAGRKAKGANI
jgi:hypothetical protein